MAFHCCEAGLEQTLILGFGQSGAKNEEKRWVILLHFGLAEKLRGADWPPCLAG